MTDATTQEFQPTFNGLSEAWKNGDGAVQGQHRHLHDRKCPNDHAECGARDRSRPARRAGIVELLSQT